jgi:F0F1-type ATP synthase epsilon subunit
VAWKGDGGEDNVEISGGFAEVFDNNVTVCVELP